MIRPFTAICVLLAGSSGLYLYTEKHRTTVLDQQISRIVQDTQRTRERTAMLRAEWALLNQPDRLAALAARFLPDLHPLAPSQFVQMAALAQHLPEIAKPAPALAAAPVAAPTLSATLVAQPVMARTLVAVDAQQEGRASSARAAPAPKRHEPAYAAQAATAKPASAPSRPHAGIRLAALRPPAHAGAMQAIQASRMAAWEGGPAAGLLQGGASYARPSPMQAAWHPAASAATGRGSALGFARTALPAPMPAPDGE